MRDDYDLYVEPLHHVMNTVTNLGPMVHTEPVVGSKLL